MESTPETLADAPPPNPHLAPQTLDSPIVSGDPSWNSPESRVFPGLALETPAIPPSQTIIGSSSSPSSGAQEPQSLGDERIGGDADIIATTADVEISLIASPTSSELGRTAVDVAATDVPSVTVDASGNPSLLQESIATTTDVKMTLTASPTSIEFGSIVIDVAATDVPAVMLETSEIPSPLPESIATSTDVKMPLTSFPASVEFGSVAIDVAETDVPDVMVETSENPSFLPESIATATNVKMPLTVSPTSIEFGSIVIGLAATNFPAVMVEPTAEKDLGKMELVYENRKSSSLKCDAEAKAEVKKSRGRPKGLDKLSSPLQYKSIDVSVILSVFLSTAINPLNLKSHRLAKTVKGFLSEYRSSVHGRDVEFQAYLDYSNHLEDVVGEPATNTKADGSKEANSVRKSNKRKIGVNDGTLLELRCDTPTGSGQGKGSKRRKMMNFKTPMISNGSESKSQNKRKGSMHGPARGEKCEDVVIGDNPMDMDSELNNCSMVRNLGQKRKKNSGEHKGGSQGGSRRQKAPTRGGKGSSQQKNIEKALLESPAALILTFAPDSILPSRDELITTFSTFGALMEPKAEILQDSNSARVVFLRSSDAEKAFNSPDRKTVFASQLSSCRFRYLPEVKSPLPSIKRTLSGMISRLTRTSSGKRGSAASWSKMEGMEDLVESIKGLLDRVDQMTESPVALLS